MCDILKSIRTMMSQRKIKVKGDQKILNIGLGDKRNSQVELACVVDWLPYWCRCKCTGYGEFSSLEQNSRGELTKFSLEIRSRLKESNSVLIFAHISRISTTNKVAIDLQTQTGNIMLLHSFKLDPRYVVLGPGEVSGTTWGGKLPLIP